MTRKVKTVAVIGGGWAGCAAAVDIARRGHQVQLFEAARALGGRARGLRPAGWDNPETDWESRLDNGQHILLGAYRQTLRLMRVVGVDAGKALLRLPLQMRYPAGSGGMDFYAARLPAPLHLAIALWRTTGLTREDKMALARFTTTARWIDWRLNQDCSVEEFLCSQDQTERVIQLLWRPLCLAALNTPPARASAQVFLNVLRDSVGARRSASDMLIPRVDLSTLFPSAAAAFIQRQGGTVQLGRRVTHLTTAAGGWRLRESGAGLSSAEATVAMDDPHFDAVIVATPASEAARLLSTLESAAKPGAGPMGQSHSIPEFAYEPITTCYLQYPASVRLPLAIHALRDDSDRQRWGQFVFDRGQLDAAQAGLLAVVVSAASEAVLMPHASLSAAIAAQLATDFDNPALLAPQLSRIISEKRATFSCTPGLQRPSATTAHDGLFLAGDYVASAYPATIEAAVRSGVEAAALVAAR